MLLHKDKMLIYSHDIEGRICPPQFALVLFSNDGNDWEIGVFIGTIHRANGFSAPVTSYLGRGLNERRVEHEYKYCRIPDSCTLPTVLVTREDGTTSNERIYASSSPDNYITCSDTKVKRKDYEND